jgi:hypothetical protein
MADCDNTPSKNFTKRRFNFFLVMFRAVGIPILFEKVPIMYKVYCAVVNTCLYIFYVSNILELFMQRDDLEHTMDTARAGAPGSAIVTTYTFLR